MTNYLFCEFCGEKVTGIHNPHRLLFATHNIYRDVTRCWIHRKTSKMSPACRTFHPLTGEARDGSFWKFKGDKR